MGKTGPALMNGMFGALSGGKSAPSTRGPAVPEPSTDATESLGKLRPKRQASALGIPDEDKLGA